MLQELSDKVSQQFVGVDESPYCVPAVRAQLFNLFDGFIEIDGRAYPIGNGYSVGMATGNIGQQFTESSNELGRALKDRMHLIIDTDYFRPQPIDTLEILAADRNPRVHFSESLEDKTTDLQKAHQTLQQKDVPFEKYVIAAYLVHGLDYLEGGKSKIEMKSGWPTKLEGHEAGSDAALVLPISPRAAKSVITFSQALDEVTREKGATELDYVQSMMAAFKFVGAYSGILDESGVREKYDNSHYKAMDAVIDTTRQQFEDQKEQIAAGLAYASTGKKSKKLLDSFQGRWTFMKSLLEDLTDKNQGGK